MASDPYAWNQHLELKSAQLVHKIRQGILVHKRASAQHPKDARNTNVSTIPLRLEAAQKIFIVGMEDSKDAQDTDVLGA